MTILDFIRTVLRNPETGEPFELFSAQERFLSEAFTLTADGRLPFVEMLLGWIKKSGKTATIAMAMLYVIRVLGGKFAEGYCVANDYDQAQGRVFQACARIVQASPMLARETKITANRIEFLETCSMIGALAYDAAGNAGANPTLTVFDELWGYTSERAHRLWDEMIPVPTRKISARLTATYAGFEGESDLLEKLYHRGLKGEEIAPSLYSQHGMLMAWHHEPVAPWQTPEWLEQMRQQLRPNAYLRMIENRWVTTESNFIEMSWWDACVDPTVRPLVSDLRLSVCVGVDASVKRDSTAIVACSWDAAAKKVRIVWHRIFQPSPDAPLDFEATIEATLLELRQRFDIEEVRFDPFQMVSSAQRLKSARVPMVEFPQTVPNLTAASTNLYELLKGGNLIAYADDQIRRSLNQAIALETSRGWRIAKEKAAHKIDVVVALAQAALSAVENSYTTRAGVIRTTGH